MGNILKTTMLKNLCILLFFIILMPLFTIQVSAESQDNPQNVLMLYSGNQFLPVNAIMNQTVEKVLKKSNPSQISIYSEYLEIDRFKSESIQSKMREIIKEKYSKGNLDVIMVMDDIALDFIVQYGDELFPKVPVVLCSITEGKINTDKIKSNMTGNFKILDIKSNIELILKVQPDIKEIVVITGTSEQDLIYKAMAQKVLNEYSLKVKVTYLENLSLNSILEKVAKLPEQSALFFVSFNQDGIGKAYIPLEVIPLISKASKAPLYGMYETFIGKGILGGNLISYADISTNAAEIVLRILNGEEASDIDIVASNNKNYFDWNEMKRWGIHPNNLPTGSIIVNKELSFWEQYRMQIILSFLVIISEMFLIILLLKNLRDRRIAEIKLEKSNQSMASILLGTNVGTWEWSVQTGETVFNERWAEMIGYTLHELSPTTIDTWIKHTNPEDLQQSEEQLKKIFSKELDYYECACRMKHKNGSWIWVSDRGKVTSWTDDGKPLIMSGTHTDMTKQKKEEEEIEHLAFCDQLTGLYNRRFYEEELRRLDTERNLPLTIIMGDLNGLKLINDSFGHRIGDELLKKVAEVLREGCRADDIVARVGGDEFVIILPKADAIETDKVISRMTQLSLNNKVGSINLSVSFGYGIKTTKKQRIQDVYKEAEDHMYRNKLYESSSIKSKMINLIMSSLYEKNNEEQLHSKRVSEICESIARKMNLEQELISQIKIAGLMHDIGKIGIDEKVLNRKGKLNESEWKEIKRHPEVGYRILSSANEFSEIATFALDHHERWDGQGYPKGLKGGEISLPARIIAIADSYDAMTRARTYREVLSEEEAIEEIKRCAGTQFDPTIVNIFVNCPKQTL